MDNADSVESAYWGPKLQTKFFNFGGVEFAVTSIREINGERWFVANQFAAVLEYKNLQKAVRQHVSRLNECYFGNLKAYRPELTNVYVQAGSRMINRRGIYELLTGSKMRYARDFRYWITNVLFASMNREPIAAFEHWREEGENASLLDYQSRSDEKVATEDVSCSSSTRTESRNNGCIYVLTNESLEPEKIYKIGSTNDLGRRVACLNTGTPVDFYAVYVFSAKEHATLERELHKLFAEKRICREFFRLDDQDFVTLVEFCERGTEFLDEQVHLLSRRENSSEN